MSKYLLNIVFFLVSSSLLWNLHAQDRHLSSNFFNNYRHKEFTIQNADSLIIDSLSIDPKSFNISGVSSNDYFLNPYSGIIYWKENIKTTIVGTNIGVFYRVLPISINKTYQNRLKPTVDSMISAGSFTINEPLNNGFIDFNAIEYYGTYGRSISIGNNQNAALNSQFNLQINGYILDSVRVEAAISDNTIPFQPEGNTQKLQEFDKLYITFEKNKHKLTAGDYTLSQPQSYFLNYTKKVQGLMFESELPIGKKGAYNKIGVSGSIAKGQYVKNVFNGSEGNQGPYKLTDNNGSRNFVVLSGTERVYIDDVLMQRGEDLDYIIDYNTAEIKFMPRQMITKDKRIQVEFEYQDRNYLNSLIYVYDEFKVSNKVKFNFNLYSNQDAKNQSINQTLTGEQKQYLSTIGDDIDRAFYQNIVADTFTGKEILYRIVDTTVNNNRYDSVFVYSTNNDSILYAVSFTNVGQGNGNYNISGMNTNGRSYVWTPPIDGIPQGSFEPILLLVTPKKHQVLTAAMTYDIDKNKQLNVEFSGTNYSPNTFSNINNEEHLGGAVKVQYKEQRYFGKDSVNNKSTTSSLQSSVNYEYVNAKFKPVNAFRNLEFNRNWNVDSSNLLQDEHLATFNSKLNLKRHFYVDYALTSYNRGTSYNALKNYLKLQLQYPNYSITALMDWMNSNDILQRSNYWKPTFQIERYFGKDEKRTTLGAKFFREDNQLKIVQTNLYGLNAFKFDEYKIYLSNQSEQEVYYNLSYTYRLDYKSYETERLKYTEGQSIQLETVIRKWQRQNISFNGTYRMLKVYQNYNEEEMPGNSLVLRAQYNGDIKKGFIVPNLLYEIGTGQEQKREYTYVEVAAGQGNYMWSDYNGDGVQQANEFELAIYDDQRRYIRVINITSDYIKVNYLNTTASVNINPIRLWSNPSEKTKKWVGAFSDVFSMQINNRMLRSDGFGVFNPFYEYSDESAVISNLVNYNNTFFINRLNPKWGLDFITNNSRSLSLLTYGVEGYMNQNNIQKFRWNLSKVISVYTNTQIGEKSFVSPVNNDGRNYQYSIQSIEPYATFLFNTNVRWTARYKYDIRENLEKYGGEMATLSSISTELKLSLKKSGILQGKFTWTNIDFDGKENTSLKYSILDGLNNGKNYLWFFNWERRLGKNLELSLEYDGRKSGDNKTVHTGSMSIRAIL